MHTSAYDDHLVVQIWTLNGRFGGGQKGPPTQNIQKLMARPVQRHEIRSIWCHLGVLKWTHKWSKRGHPLDVHMDRPYPICTYLAVQCIQGCILSAIYMVHMWSKRVPKGA